jgi:hypothetical protein
LQLPTPIASAFSSPDGTCLFISGLVDNNPYIQCYHLASFGSTEGIKLGWPAAFQPDVRMFVTSLGQRDTIHALFLDTQSQICRSILIQVTHKSSDYHVQTEGKLGIGSTNGRINSANPLIDCHSEVWTRFPVYATIRREITDIEAQARSITFVSSALGSDFAPYFLAMVQKFCEKVQKPTNNILSQIGITAITQWNPSTVIPTSTHPMGEWLMGLFCLIPIQVAITESNCFVPLKDGLYRPDFETELLGADVTQISDA